MKIRIQLIETAVETGYYPWVTTIFEADITDDDFSEFAKEIVTLVKKGRNEIILGEGE